MNTVGEIEEPLLPVLIMQHQPPNVLALVRSAMIGTMQQMDFSSDPRHRNRNAARITPLRPRGASSDDIEALYFELYAVEFHRSPRQCLDRRIRNHGFLPPSRSRVRLRRVLLRPGPSAFSNHPNHAY